MARACGDLSIWALKNAVRRLVVMKRRGHARRQGLIDAGLLAVTMSPACDVTADPQASGGIRVALDVGQGATFGEIMAKAVKRDGRDA